MKMSRWQSGFTLIEMLVVIAISVIIFGALFITVEYVLRSVTDSRARTSALSLANDRLEYFRSLSYDNVGTISGIPSGTIPQNSTTTLNDIIFSERVLVEYVDDPGDGLLTATTTDSNGIPSDYKRLKIEISWTIYNETENISLVSNIVPRSIETTAGGGTVRINVIDADSNPLVGAAVTLVNTTTAPNINVTKASDSTGTVLFSGAPAGSNYEVSVAAAGYSTDQTYVASVANPSPITAPFSVLEADISTLTFQIGTLSDIQVDTFSDITEVNVDEWFDDASGVAVLTQTAVTAGTVRLTDTAGVYDSSGVAYLNEVVPTTLESWEVVTLAGNDSSATDFRIKFYTLSAGVYSLIPDGDLAGNSTGFDAPLIDLAGLSTVTYPSLVVGVHLATTDSSVTPTVDAVELFYRESATPRASVAFSTHGAKVIGYDMSAAPIYKTTLAATTDGAGNAGFVDVEFDSYEFIFPATYTVARSCPILPLLHRAGVDSFAEVVLVPSVSPSLLLSVVDMGGNPVAGANVTLSRSGFSDTVRANSCGQVFFSTGVAVEVDYQINISKSAYDSVLVDPYDLSGNSAVTIIMNES
jgi:prepilin-type N-terminal cleavage/methylation domain-containing protein